MSQNPFILIQDDQGEAEDEDFLVDLNTPVATLGTTPFLSQHVDGFDFCTPDLNLPATESDTSTVRNNTPSRSLILAGSDPDPDPDSSVVDVDGGNQVSFVMNLFGQRIEQSGRDPNPDPDFGDEDVSMENMEMGFYDDWGEQSDLDPGLGPDLGYADEDDGCSGLFCADCDDGFLESLGGSGTVSEDYDSVDLVEHDFFLGDLGGGDIDLVSRDIGHGVMNHFAFGDENVDDGEDIYLGDEVDVNYNQDLVWEEIGVLLENQERDVLSMVYENEGDDDASVVPESGEVGVERNEEMVNLEWEVLLNIHNLEMNHGFGLDDEYGDYIDDEQYTVEDYAALFGQLGEDDSAIEGRPPASKAVVENLDSVLITEDGENDNVICAVCKDEMNVGESAKQLPCSHQYHEDCIMPWLGIRNTCPVCRYELPTDDPDYELRRRGLFGVQIQ